MLVSIKTLREQRSLVKTRAVDVSPSGAYLSGRCKTSAALGPVILELSRGGFGTNDDAAAFQLALLYSRPPKLVPRV